MSSSFSSNWAKSTVLFGLMTLAQGQSHLYSEEYGYLDDGRYGVYGHHEPVFGVGDFFDLSQVSKTRGEYQAERKDDRQDF